MTTPHDPKPETPEDRASQLSKQFADAFFCLLGIAVLGTFGLLVIRWLLLVRDWLF